MVNVFDMETLGDDRDAPCVKYLKTLLASDKNLKFNFCHFQGLMSKKKISNDTTLFDILTVVLELLKKCDKNFQMCGDLVHCFCHVLSSTSVGVSAMFDILRTDEMPNIIPHHAGDISHFIRDNRDVLILGVLKYFVAERYEFTADEFDILITKVEQLSTAELLRPNNVNTLLCVVDAWLSVVRQTSVDNEILKRVYASVMSVVIIYWNIDIAEFRNRVEDLFLRCLCVNYEKDTQQQPRAKELNVLAKMSTLGAIAHDMSWSLPFKYYAYVIALRFISKAYNLSKFLEFVRDDLRIGFLMSLQNRRVIGAETELFKFCTTSISLDEWKELFDPIIDAIFSSENVIIAKNFSRHWLPIIVKNFPQYAVDLLERIPNGDIKRAATHSRILFALFKVCLARKIQCLPVEDRSDKFVNYLRVFLLDHEDTRGELFALLCNLGDQSELHSEEELEIILIFLRDNARTSSTMLRQNMFSSFARFVLRLICSGVKAIKSDDDNVDRRLGHVLQFLLALNEFFADGIKLGCCYQRKLISLTLYKIFTTYALHDCGGEIRRNNLKDVEKFVEFVRARGAWRFNNSHNCSLLFRCLMDPCEEIQNLSFALLRTFFDLTAVNEGLATLSDVFKLLNDSLFYKRNSGVSAMLSLICLSYNAGNNAHVDLLESVYYRGSTFTDMFLHRLEMQVSMLQDDVLNSALHQPLDATVKVLTFLMTHSSSPEFSVISATQIEKLISLLEIAVPILLKALFIDKFADYAPSFEESDRALQAIIQNSSIADKLNVCDSKDDKFQLKPINQILLNFIWITLKVCAEIESYLILSRIRSLNEAQLIRCCELVVKKLKLCRHKGVIEAAGISLSCMVKALTEHNTCEIWLESVIREIVFLIEHKSGATLSRKSAGLSLLVQNIVGNDKRPNKPLLSLCWSEFRRILNVDYSMINQSILEELPQVHVLHFLKVLIADARNNVELSVYFEEITLVCLKTLKVPVWTVRNAALQLFGAIVPKMVGQKNSLNDFGVRRSFEEVFLRMPLLLEHVVSAFEQSPVDAAQKLTYDADLVPLLIILANVHVCGVHSMVSSLYCSILRLRRSTRCLLGSEVHFVRELASKSFVVLYGESEISIFKTIMDDVNKYLMDSSMGSTSNIAGENQLHGYLLVLEYAFSSYAFSPSFQKQVMLQHSAFSFGPRFEKISLKSAALLFELEISSCAKTNPLLILNHLTKMLDDLPRKKHLLVGYDTWVNTLLRKIFKYSDKNSFHQVVSFCLNNRHNSIRHNFLKMFSTSSNCSSSTVIFDLLYSCLKKHLISNVDRVALNYLFNVFIKLNASRVKLVDNEYFSGVYSMLIDLDHNEFQAAGLRVLTSLTTPVTPDWQLNVILSKVSSLLDMSRYRKDVRVNAATSLLTLCNYRENQIDVRGLWLNVIEVVQDEEMEIRLIGCECYQRLVNCCGSLPNPEIVLVQLFDIQIMKKLLPFNDISDILWVSVAIEHFDAHLSEDNIINPFDQGVLNVYKEEVRTISAAGRSLIDDEHMKAFIRDCSDKQKIIVSFYQTHFIRITETAENVLNDHFLVSAASYVLAMRCYYILLIFVQLCKKSSMFDCDLKKYCLSAEKFSDSLRKTFDFF